MDPSRSIFIFVNGPLSSCRCCWKKKTEPKNNACSAVKGTFLLSLFIFFSPNLLKLKNYFLPRKRMTKGSTNLANGVS